MELKILVITAVSIGFFHTLFGPDHYLPFIVMGRAGRWSIIKTILVTFLCGIGHIGSSVLLGMVGIALGIAVSKIEAIETFRGSLAAWALIAFGLMYFVWGLHKALRNRPHQHWHSHLEDKHIHEHVHIKEHAHVHTEGEEINFTAWILFTIFIFGPCEPLIPILMYPAAKTNLGWLILVVCMFGAITILTMLSLVLVSILGMRQIPLGRLERYSHALAGATIFFCGMAIQFLGL